MGEKTEKKKDRGNRENGRSTKDKTSTRHKDMTIKPAKYAASRVKEYWIVDIAWERVTVYDFAHDDNITIYGFDNDVPVGIRNGACKVNFRQIMNRL